MSSSARRRFLSAAALGALWPCPAAAAKVWRVGLLDRRPRGHKDSWAQRFGNAMQELGYVEGRDIQYVHTANIPELVESRPDAIVANGTSSTKALQRATTTIPIVTNVGDPVRSGFAKSLVRPGGNITGMALAMPETFGKWFEHLKSIIPGNWTLAIADGGENPDFRSTVVAAVEEAARSRGIPTRAVNFQGKDAAQIDRELASMRGQGIRVLSAWKALPGVDNEVYGLVLATKYGLATAPVGDDEVERGALMSYNPTGQGQDERKAFQLARILRGTPPGEIPFETPTTFNLLINRKTAKILGLTIPREVLLLADHVFE